jgi:hypothetical protein
VNSRNKQNNVYKISVCLKMSEPFSIVDFQTESHVSVVPIACIGEDKGQCKWPSAIGIRLINLIKKLPEKPSSDSFPYQICE